MPSITAHCLSLKSLVYRFILWHTLLIPVWLVWFGSLPPFYPSGIFNWPLKEFIDLNLRWGGVYLACIPFLMILGAYSLEYFVWKSRASADDLREMQKRLKFPFTLFLTDDAIVELSKRNFLKCVQTNRKGAVAIITCISLLSCAVFIALSNLETVLIGIGWLAVIFGSAVSLWNLGYSLLRQ